MLVTSVEAVTRGASAAYGADAVARVVNFRLDRGLEGVKYSLQGGTTTYSDGGQYKACIAFGAGVGERGHLIASAETWNHEVSDRSSFYVEMLLADSEQANVWQTAALRRFRRWGARRRLSLSRGGRSAARECVETSDSV